jgi:MFS family permease
MNGPTPWAGQTFIGSGQSVALSWWYSRSGNLADRFAPASCCGRTSVGTGLLAFATVPVAAIFIIGYGLIAGVGFATANMHLISTALAKLFKENRGLATGIANSGATAGQFITVPLLAIGLTWFSWRWSIIAAAAACALMALVIWIMLKPTEEEAAQKSETISDDPDPLNSCHQSHSPYSLY